MVFHIRPMCYSDFKNTDLLFLDIQSLGIHLEGGTDLVTRHPFPNKMLAVACRKKGNKAMDGILIETSGPVTEFTCEATWGVAATYVAVHKVNYKIIDTDFDAASANIFLWRGHDGWKDRRPEWWSEGPMFRKHPVMQMVPSGLAVEADDVLDAETGLIAFREQTFRMPTLERERVVNTKLTDRMPSVHDIFFEGPIRPIRCRNFIRHPGAWETDVPF